jgi:hypothetical protein
MGKKFEQKITKSAWPHGGSTRVFTRIGASAGSRGGQVGGEKSRLEASGTWGKGWGDKIWVKFFVG